MVVVSFRAKKVAEPLCLERDYQSCHHLVELAVPNFVGMVEMRHDSLDGQHIVRVQVAYYYWEVVVQWVVARNFLDTEDVASSYLDTVIADMAAYFEGPAQDLAPFYNHRAYDLAGVVEFDSYLVQPFLLLHCLAVHLEVLPLMVLLEVALVLFVVAAAVAGQNLMTIVVVVVAA